MSWNTSRRPKISNKLGIPTQTEGSDGDIQIRQTNLGSKLFGKIGGRWYSTFLSKEEEIIGTSGTRIGMSSDGALSVDQINLTGKITLTSTYLSNVCIGTNNSDLGAQSIFLGVKAGQSAVDGMNSNIAIGHRCMQYPATGVTCVDNIAIGTLALQNMDGTGTSYNGEYKNIAIGSNTARFLDEGIENIMMGFRAMQGNLSAGTGNDNRAAYCIAIGHQAIQENTAGIGNVAVGFKANWQGTSGIYNISIGYQSGLNITTGDYNICIGTNLNASGAGTDRSIVIGDNITGTSEALAFGKSGSVILSSDFDTGTVAWGQSSDVRKKRNINNDNLGLEFINKLKNRTFQWKPSEEHPEEWGNFTYVDEKGEKVDSEADPVLDKDGNPLKEYSDINIETIRHGFIAQEVKEALDECGVDTFPIWKEDENGQQRLYNGLLVLPLTKAVQELSAKMDTMQTEINNLKSE